MQSPVRAIVLPARSTNQDKCRLTLGSSAVSITANLQ